MYVSRALVIVYLYKFTNIILRDEVELAWEKWHVLNFSLLYRILLFNTKKKKHNYFGDFLRVFRCNFKMCKINSEHSFKEGNHRLILASLIYIADAEILGGLPRSLFAECRWNSSKFWHQYVRKLYKNL